VDSQQGYISFDPVLLFNPKQLVKKKTDGKCEHLDYLWAMVKNVRLAPLPILPVP